MDDFEFEELLVRLQGKTDDEIAEIIANDYPEIIINSLVKEKKYSELAELLGMTVGEVRLALYEGKENGKRS